VAREFRLPDLGEGLQDAEVVQVLVREGEEIREDQAVFLVETEKAQVELPSPHGGRVARVHVRAGERVKVGAVLLTLDAGGPAAGAAPGPAAAAAGPPPAGPGPGQAAPAAPPRAGALAGAPRGGLPPAATPATRRLARELGVDLAAVAGTGAGGRITDDDVRRAAPGAGPAAAAPEAPPEPGRPLAAAAELPPLPRFEQWGPVQREPLRGVRRRSAERLGLAWATVPHFTVHYEADVTDLEALRRRQQALVRERGGELTLTVLLVKAAAVALRAHPRVNASLDAQAGELVLKGYRHVGVAVDTPGGLLVPVLRDADAKRVLDLARELPALVQRTREGKATVEDLRGGTFTITNVGAIGPLASTPIINYPEVAILGVGRAGERAVARGGQVTARLVLPLSLAFDHRVIDGMEAARFASDLVGLLESPERLLLEG
jgi:pyruvate dehydrogenase E2 component (dihydrolipoamide acetyltransferase)